MAKISGQKQRLDWLFQSRYKDIKRRAEYMARSSRNIMLNATALVHESYTKLVKSERLSNWPTTHFENVIGQTMKQIAVDQARQNAARKRGGADAVMLPLDDMRIAKSDSTESDLIIQDCLEQLRAMDGRQAKVFEHRFLEGMSSRQTAETLGISEPTVEREVAFLRAWLKSRLNLTG